LFVVPSSFETRLEGAGAPSITSSIIVFDVQVHSKDRCGPYSNTSVLVHVQMDNRFLGESGDASRAWTRSDFPEHQFSISSEDRQWYSNLVARGSHQMARQRVVICGLARNLEHVLPATITRFERLGEMFLDYRAVVFENDSHDATREILADWAAGNRRVAVLSERIGDPLNPCKRCPRRGTRMAKYRNRYRDYVAERFAHFDVAIVIDMDLAAGFSYEGVCNTFGHRNWDFVGSYGIIFRRARIIGIRIGPIVRMHYDAWAFRRLGDDTALTTRYVNAMKWRRGDSLVRVNSCFGGLGVYRIEAILRSRYEGGDCEHVGFHRNMRRHGLTGLYLNPNQIVNHGFRGSSFLGLRRVPRAFPIPIGWLDRCFTSDGIANGWGHEDVLRRQAG